MNHPDQSNGLRSEPETDCRRYRQSACGPSPGTVNSPVRGLLAACWFFGCLAGAHAETIYKAPGNNGPVYSDTPAAGSRAIDLPRGNNALPPPKPPPAPDAKTEKPPAPPQAERYRDFRIVYPEDMGSAAANTSAFEVRVAVEPPLQTQFGHAFTVSLNGKPVGKRYFFTEMLIPPEFFGDSIRVNESFRAEASIVDREGNVVMTAKPVDFTMRHVPPRPRRRDPSLRHPHP